MGTQWGAFLFLARTSHSLSIPELSHYQVRNYVRSYASYLNINSNDENPAAAYNTRVERVEKRANQVGQGQGWRLWLRFPERTPNNTYRATWWTEVRFPPLVCLGYTCHFIRGCICRISMRSSSPWAGTMCHRCLPFPVWRSGSGDFLTLSTIRDNTGDQKGMQIRPYLSLVHLCVIRWKTFFVPS